MNWQFLLYILGVCLMGWLAYRMVKNNPEAFSWENISKSITTVGILTLLMIAFIAVCILLLKHL
jgi:hypothetical protein